MVVAAGWPAAAWSASTQERQITRPKTLSGLDGLRGVAAIMVVLCHISRIVPHGYLAVDFFFCLSGFILAYVYDERLRNGLPFVDFAVARLIRLYPMVLIGVLFGFCIYWIRLGSPDAPALFRDLGVDLLLLPTASPDAPNPTAMLALNPPFWSLSYELAVSLAWALALRRIPPFVLFALTLAATIAASLALGLSDINRFIQSANSGLPALRTLLGFSAGLVTFALFKRGVAGRLRFGLALPATALVVLLLVPKQPDVWFDIACVVFAFPAITLVAASAVLGPRMTGAARWLGWISYPLYATHFPLVMMVVGPLLVALPSLLPLPSSLEPTFGAYLVVDLAASLAVATLAGRADEAIRNWLTDKWRGGRITRPVALAPEGS
jgi:peptidoglycan/LPS O-acetylase OafA/YrhL